MSARSEWLYRDQLEIFIIRRGGRAQSATELWQLITTRFPGEIQEVYQRDILRLRQTESGEVEVSLRSVRAAMEVLDPCWIRGYGARQHRWLKEWLSVLYQQDT